MSTANTKRVNSMSLVRILAALLIVNYHTSKLEVPLLQYVARFGFVFNTVFVFLSGYLLTKSMLTRPDTGFRAFWIRRVSRIYPAYHLSLLATWCIYLLIGRSVSLRSALLAVTGFQYYLHDSAFGTNLWFVSVILTCYLLFIPTFRLLKRIGIPYLIGFVILFISLAIFREGSLTDIYSKTSGDPIYRFLYHYIVFSLGIIWKLWSDKERVFTVAVALPVMLLAFPAYVWAHGSLSFSVLALPLAILVALAFTGLVQGIFPLVQRRLPVVFSLAPVTYELYLVHKSVIEWFDVYLHGTLWSYGGVFVVATGLAFAVHALAQPYARLMERLWTQVLGLGSRSKTRANSDG